MADDGDDVDVEMDEDANEEDEKQLEEEEGEEEDGEVEFDPAEVAAIEKADQRFDQEVDDDD